MEKLNNLPNTVIYELVLDGSIKRFPRNFWDKQSTVEITKYFIEDKMRWTEEDIKNKLDAKTFINNKLRGMLKIFNNSPYNVINNAYPGKFKPWELKITYNNFWNLETSKDAIIWMIEEKLQWSDEDIKENLSYKTFRDNRLSGMLELLPNASIYNVINNAYPGRFKPWELQKVHNNFWNLENGKDATIWMIEEKLQWSDEDIENGLTYKIFNDNGLAGMMQTLFDGSPFKAINNAYPGKFKLQY